MLLVYTEKITPRISYIFKHICTRILGLPVSFIDNIEEWIAHEGAKISYGRKPLGNELFFQSHGLLTQQGIESVEVVVKDWEETIGFFAVGSNSILPFDIFAAGFYLMSRYEEYLPHVKDSLGRFPANESLGQKEGFLQRPVVDIWALKFKAVLQKAFPNLSFLERDFIIHNVVVCRQPYAFKQKGFFRVIVGYLQDLFKIRLKQMVLRTQVLLRFRRDPFDTYKWLINISRKREQKLTVFFLLGESNVFEESFNTYRQKFKWLVKYVNDYKEVGLLFSAYTMEDYELMKEEKQQLESITNRTLESAMNSNYFVKLPELYRDMVELEIPRDFTMAYEDTPGFRAGTCTPFLFYDLDFEIKTPLTVHPIAASSSAFESKFASDITKTVLELFHQVKAVQGTFSMRFSNQDFSEFESNKVWRNLYSEKL